MSDLPNLPCYLNGEFTQLPDAKVSVMDRGFVFGDGVYEVIPVYRGRMFRFDAHMARLARSLAEIRIANPMTANEWHDVAIQLIANHADCIKAPPQNIDQLLYLQVTRGVALREHAMLPGLTPTVFMMANALPAVPDALRSAGAACVTADDFRWEKAHIKTTSLLGAVFARQIAVDAGAAETVMFRRGFLSEASASNVWVVQQGRVLGPPRDHLVLEGVRYGLIEALCAEAGIPFELRRITRDEVLAADELLLSSATKEVLAVTRLDGRPVGAGVPGPVYARLYQGYQQAKIQSWQAMDPHDE
ncbi:MAG: D-alanine aminotransferase [Burkholderiaceae bacterium]|jgi:D-alanine transaminase|nr:MAG: D-alanine aminotransferase [Burkholderiaceae bacterium]